MTAPAFDPAAFGGDPQAPPVPMVISRDDLDPLAYSDTLDGLSRWLAWFRRTYRIPATLFPPCWYTHPGIREDLGHLWTGWLITRHPDAGVGMIGLDWDSRREQAIARLREATAITGCTGTRHQAEQRPQADHDPRLWDDHLQAETQSRTRATAYRAAVDVITEQLQSLELRHDLAPALLAETAAEPSTATPEDRKDVAAQLVQLAARAVEKADNTAADAVRAVTDHQDITGREARVAQARAAVADLAAATAVWGTPTGSVTPAEVAAGWLTALEELLPAQLAADRAAAAAAARAAAVDRRLSVGRRHPDIADLLTPGTNPGRTEPGGPVSPGPGGVT
jgi:hypothetical protein